MGNIGSSGSYSQKQNQKKPLTEAESWSCSPPALTPRSLTIGLAARCSKGKTLNSGDSCPWRFIKITSLSFKIFEQVAGWLPPSLGGLLVPAITHENKAEAFAQHNISSLWCFLL